MECLTEWIERNQPPKPLNKYQRRALRKLNNLKQTT
jgi:hypothetical protein